MVSFVVLKKANELALAKIKAYDAKTETYEFEGNKYPLTAADKNYVQFRKYDFILVVFFIYAFTVLLTGIKTTGLRLTILIVICILMRAIIMVVDVQMYKKL
jgi:hypothetical protein